MDWARELAERLNVAAAGEKAAILAEYQQMSGKSTPTLYRIAAAHGYDSGRKRRQDRGTLKCGITDGQLAAVSALIQETSRQVKGAILPLSEAMQLAIDSGILAPGQVSESRLQAILRERDMNSTALDSTPPSIRMASEHPNHVHIFDASICIQYYLAKGKGLRIMDERDFREKKPENFAKVKDRLIRMVLADHFSHYLFVKYYLARGENQQITYDFLTSAWRGDLHEKLPFRGVPRMLLMDAGSANVAKGILNLLERLGIEIPKNMPHNPRRQGSAECAQELIETHFEARLRLEPATGIEQLNEWATDWLVWWNTTRVHRRHRMTRTACWLTIRESQLVDLPADDLLQDLYAEPEVERTVRQDCTITFRNQEYRLKHVDGIRPGRKVTVVLRPYHWPEVAVRFNDTEYLVQPIGKLAGGFSADAAMIGREYKALPESPVQKVRKINENLAYGEERGKDALPFGGTLQVFGHQADKIGNVAPMPRRGTPMEVSRSVVQALPIMALFIRLREAGVEMDAGLNKELRLVFGPTIAPADIDEVVRAITCGEDWRPVSATRQAL